MMKLINNARNKTRTAGIKKARETGIIQEIRTEISKVTRKKPGGQQSANRGDKPKPNPAKPQNSSTGKPNSSNKKRRRPNNPTNKSKGPKKED